MSKEKIKRLFSNILRRVFLERGYSNESFT